MSHTFYNESPFTTTALALEKL